MRVKLLPALFFLTPHFIFSQAEKPIKGRVFHDSFLLEKVEVINRTTKTSTTTNGNGEFVIQAKANDSLYFYAKEYYLKKIKLTNQQIEQNNLVIAMLKKPEELEEVVIKKKVPSNFSWEGTGQYKQDKRDELKLAKAATSPKTGVYDGTIENGMDFKRIGKSILDFLIKEKEKSETVPEIEFAELAKNTCDQKFYLETLKLKPEEIDLFLQFCDADPKSKTLIKQHNVLSMMDFLSAKNIEFQKLNAIVK